MNFDPTDAQRAFEQRVRAFAAERVAPRAAAIDRDGVFPPDVAAALAAEGLMGMTVPTSWGGGGVDHVSYALAIEVLARSSAVAAAIATVNNSLIAEPLAAFGTDAQRTRWLRRIATGEAIGAFALSEEHAGSDAGNQQTLAEPDGDGFRLTGRKVWVANAEAAALAIVFATSRPGDRGRGISAFLVPMDAPGLTRTAAADSLGVRGLGCMDLELNRVHVDAGDVLGKLGDGFRVALWALDGGRVAIAAQALGIGAAALDAALAHARTRQAFGEPIGAYQAIQWMLADMATELDAARMLTWKAADALDRSDRTETAASAVTPSAAMAKLLASESAHRAADKALQILASSGYRRGSEAERLFRDARATEIYQGTSAVQRMVIADHILS
jgi:butyryl-CoA dehydrogenase